MSEADYLYGLGPIIVRVVEVIEVVDYRAAPWWAVTGDVANGTPANHGGWVDRHVYLRESALPAARSARTNPSR